MRWDNLRVWQKGGLIGAVTALVLILILWIRSSWDYHCILPPLQLINVGGATCGWGNFGFSISLIVYSVIFLGIVALIGFIIGIFIGGIIRLIKYVIGKTKK